jgi:hypothetical protein
MWEFRAVEWSILKYAYMLKRQHCSFLCAPFAGTKARRSVGERRNVGVYVTFALYHWPFT